MKHVIRNKHFDRLTEIVGEVYGVEPRLLLSKLLIREISTPRRILGALWARGESYESAARLIGWADGTVALRASYKVQELFHEPNHAYRIRMILDRCKEELPWLVVE